MASGFAGSRDMPAAPRIRQGVLRDLARVRPAPGVHREPSVRLVRRLASFVQGHPRCLDRAYGPGHLTASGFVVDPGSRKILLILHRKLGRWLQPGGHLERGEAPRDAAEREVREETGLDVEPAAQVPFDVDVHRIPARKAEPAHAHFDLRYLFWADASRRAQSAEVEDACWVSLSDLDAWTDETSILRMAVRLEGILGDLPGVGPRNVL
mgnify:CR=1 FL=1